MKRVNFIIANMVIIFTLMTMIRIHLPMDKKFFKLVFQPVDHIQRFLGTNQTWMMFSPNPSRLDAFVTGEVTYEDGSKDSYDFQGNQKLSLLEKYLYGEKLRKYASENLRQDSNKFLWNDAGQYVLKKLKARNNYKIPIRVSLVRHWSETPDWDKVLMKHSDNKQKYERFTFYSKEVE